METASSSIIKTNTFSTIKLNADDVVNATSNYGTLAKATRAGAFSPITASDADIVAVEENEDGSAVIVVVAERTVFTNTQNTAS